MVPMRDGARLNTFVFLPESGGPRFPVILHRTPYGIAAADARDKFDHTNAWLPSAAEPMRGSILRGWKNIVARGYVAVYQDCRGRHGSEGEDRVYADDRADGYDTLDWIAGQDWCNQRVGMSGSSAGATTTFAAASTRHPSLRAFFAQAGASSIMPMAPGFAGTLLTMTQAIGMHQVRRPEPMGGALPVYFNSGNAYRRQHRQ